MPLLLPLALAAPAVLGACSDSSSSFVAPAGGGPAGGSSASQHRPAPYWLPAELDHISSFDAAAGRDVFRYETFGNERFWTDALRLPQGIFASGMTPLDALQIGLSVNASALDQTTRMALFAAAAEIDEETPAQSTILGDPALLRALVNMNAVVGLVAFDETGERKPFGNESAFDPEDELDIAGGDRVGVTCALCHARTNGSLLGAAPDELGTYGAIGGQRDGETAHDLDVGALLAVASNTLAYYPMLQVRFDALGGLTIGRGDFAGLAGASAAEAQADAYLTGMSAATGERYYPRGQFDPWPDGVGNPVHIAPAFAAEQGAPWGSGGGLALLEDFTNVLYTVTLDPTSIATVAGQQLLEQQAGEAGAELHFDYRAVLQSTGVDLQSIPFVDAIDGLPAGAQGSLAGRRVDDVALRDLNAYLDSLPSPRAPNDIDQGLAAVGRQIFMLLELDGPNCTTCHNVDPDKFVNPTVLPFSATYPAYADSIVVLADREGLAPMQNSGGASNLIGPSPFFDDRAIVFDGSMRGEPKGTAFPMLLDLVGRRALLHDGSVRGTSFSDAARLLLDPTRGPTAAHPFYFEVPLARDAVVEFLRSLQTIGNPASDDSTTDLPTH